MIKTWQLQEAKSKFSEVVNKAVDNGPQIITKRGIEVAIVLSYTEYRQLMAAQAPLSQFFQNSPLAAADLDLNRDKSPIRDSELDWVE